MPPFLLLIGVAFVVLMVMFGNNPMDQIRAEREKYGRDPLARDIKKFNEEHEKKGGTSLRQYKPPPGATIYRLPADEAQLPVRKPEELGTGDDKMVRPAPDMPMSEWDNPYPKYMMNMPPSNTIVTPEGSGDGRSMNRMRRGTSLVPGSGE